MMLSFIKNKILLAVVTVFLILWCMLPLNNIVDAAPPKYERDFASDLKQDNWVYDPGNFDVKENQTLRENIVSLFYPSENGWNNIYHIIRDITLWVMIIFIVMTWASLLINRKTEESKKHLTNLLYILLWWVFIYGANRLFWNVLHFNSDEFAPGDSWWIWRFTGAMIWRDNNSVLFVILSAIKAFAFFLAIIMIVVTGFKVMAAGEWEKWKKLVKWLINVVVALLVIKWVDFIYYLAEDSGNFVKNASDFIINVAKVFWYIYWVIIVIMVIVAWYLYITDGGTGDHFKKASNVLVNILLSALVLFSFLLIAYQIFAEFQTWWDALNESQEAVETPVEPSNTPSNSDQPTAFITQIKSYT